MVHIVTNTLTRLAETDLSTPPLSLSKDILNLSFDVVRVESIYLSKVTQSIVPVKGRELNQTKATSVAAVVTGSPPTFTDDRVELGFLTNVAHDNGKCVSVSNTLVLECFEN